jgi:uncharacterized protein YcfJ
MSNNTVACVTLSLLLGGSAVMAESFSTVEYVRVTQSTPLYSTVQENVPSEQCYDVREEVNYGAGNSNVGGALVGGILGGVLGHQIGGGSGKTAATVGGAVLGTLAGQRVAANAQAEGTSPGYRIVRKCETRYTYQARQVRSGYANVAKFKGQEIQIVSDQPLREIPVTVTYSY